MDCKDPVLTFRKLPTEFPDVFEVFFKNDEIEFSYYSFMGMLVGSKFIVARYNDSRLLFKRQFPKFSIDESLQDVQTETEKRLGDLVAFHLNAMTQEDWNVCLSKSVLEKIENRAADYKTRYRRLSGLENDIAPLEVLVSENFSLKDLSSKFCNTCYLYITENELAALLTDCDTTQHYQNTWQKIMKNPEVMEECKLRLDTITYIRKDLQNPESPILKAVSILAAVKNYTKISIKIKNNPKPFKLKGCLKYAMTMDGIHSSDLSYYGAGGRALFELYSQQNNTKDWTLPYDDIENISFDNQVIWQQS